MKPEFEIYTDGACIGNGQKDNIGGWSFVIVENDKNISEAVGVEFNTTNNRQEILGVLNSLRCCVEHDIESFVIYSDSQYVVKGFNDWMYGWALKRWMRKGELIPNADLWKDMFEIKKSFEKVDLQWVRGHNGNKWNEHADQLIEKEMALKLR
jgi:ribonuclease HI